MLSGLLIGCASTPTRQEPVEPTVEQDVAINPEAETPAAEGASSANRTGATPLMVKADPRPQDPINIESAKIEGNVLTLNVAHGGGCAEHTYELAWDGNLQSKAGATPVANLVLIHDGHGDRCKAMKFAELRFDVSAIAKEQSGQSNAHGTVDLALLGVSAPVSYSF
ncbi:hypothetical protein LXT21_03150 [Myxococcus sp. K38C18041901]|uniref:hypothetical protein n=1 Tax=Myxococcus guangdongensis TaxID=2906760 RepID=UPI0020A724C6|nr:hypothetical protein [Myxococcus guangdongensis]MCP3057769.1 hypothetical protein [Myxococcus guangdongensis]